MNRGLTLDIAPFAFSDGTLQVLYTWLRWYFPLPTEAKATTEFCLQCGISIFLDLSVQLLGLSVLSCCLKNSPWEFQQTRHQTAVLMLLQSKALLLSQKPFFTGFPFPNHCILEAVV